MLPDRINNPFGPGERHFIAEPENGPAEVFQVHLSEMISQDDIIPIVNPTVDLQDQPEPVAGEVGEVAADRVLATEAVPIDLRAAKPLP